MGLILSFVPIYILSPALPLNSLPDERRNSCSAVCERSSSRLWSNLLVEMNAITVPTFQVACAPSLFPRNTFRSNNASFPSYPSPNNASFPLFYVSPKLPKVCLEVTLFTSGYRRAATVCLFGGKGKSENGNEASPWKAIENAMDKFKKDQSIEDILKDQIQKQEYYSGGGSGGKSSGRGGGGGGEEGGEGEGGTEGEGFRERADEFLQAFLATVGIVFLYIFIIEGEEITVLAKDMIKLLFTRQMSIRLRRLIDQWKSFYEEMKEEDNDPYELERVIFSMSTCYDGPRKYRWLKKYRPDMLQDLTLLPEDDEKVASEQEK